MAPGAQPQRGHEQQYACLRCASRANRCVGRNTVRADTADMDTVGALQRGENRHDTPWRTAAGRTGSASAPCVGQGARARALIVRATPACWHGRARARRGLVCRRPLHSQSLGARCRQTVLARSATYPGLSDPVALRGTAQIIRCVSRRWPAVDSGGAQRTPGPRLMQWRRVRSLLTGRRF